MVRTTLMAFAIIQLTSRIISLGALMARRSGRSALIFSRSRIGPGNLVSSDKEFAKQVCSISSRHER